MLRRRTNSICRQPRMFLSLIWRLPVVLRRRPLSSPRVPRVRSSFLPSGQKSRPIPRKYAIAILVHRRLLLIGWQNTQPAKKSSTAKKATEKTKAAPAKKAPASRTKSVEKPTTTKKPVVATKKAATTTKKAATVKKPATKKTTSTKTETKKAGSPCSLVNRILILCQGRSEGRRCQGKGQVCQ